MYQEPCIITLTIVIRYVWTTNRSLVNSLNDLVRLYILTFVGMREQTRENLGMLGCGQSQPTQTLAYWSTNPRQGRSYEAVYNSLYSHAKLFSGKSPGFTVHCMQLLPYVSFFPLQKLSKQSAHFWPYLLLHDLWLTSG
jgi:hypothetical protein